MKARGFQNVPPAAVPECPPLRRRGIAFPLDKARLRGIMKIQKGAVDLTVGPLVSQKIVDRTGTSRAVNELL